jgi:nucleoside 2-deoxyribosyltransferase
MWFDRALNAAWSEGFEPAITAAGYKPMRIDLREHVNKICDEIIAEIRRSRFVVADYTGYRGGVYYETGYAKGRGIEVISTCRKDQFEQLHFDVRQFDCISWETPADLARQLQTRIEAVIGDGPFKRAP